MNRKIQDTDALFIVARYKRDQHTFDARQEAEKYGVSLRTIHSVLTKAGIQMRRGRKPLQPPQPLISPPPPITPRKGPPVIRPNAR